jgi:hypothetical protein
MGVSAVAVGLERLVSTPVNIALGPIYTYVLGKEVTNTQPVSRPTNCGGD